MYGHLGKRIEESDARETMCYISNVFMKSLLIHPLCRSAPNSLKVFHHLAHSTLLHSTCLTSVPLLSSALQEAEAAAKKGLQ